MDLEDTPNYDTREIITPGERYKLYGVMQFSRNGKEGLEFLKITQEPIITLNEGSLEVISN